MKDHNNKNRIKMLEERKAKLGILDMETETYPKGTLAIMFLAGGTIGFVIGILLDNWNWINLL